MMKLDSNRAWKDASRNVSRNREAILAVAGVFFLVPQLALALFFPQPEPTVGMSEQQMFELLQAYYLATLPALLPMVVCQALGTVTLLTLLSHAARPTVGEALRRSLPGVLTYLGAQILLGIGIGFGGGLVLSVLALSGTRALLIAGLLLVLVAIVAVVLRVSLSAAVVAIEGQRNPVKALRRSWALTSGNGWRLFSFYALVFVAFLVIQMVLGIVIGIPLAMLGGGHAAQVATALVSSLLNAVMAVYLVGIVGAVHQQLAGMPAEQERQTFE
jgi:hypothetical protein